MRLHLVYSASSAGGVYMMEPGKAARTSAERHEQLRRLVEINKDAQAWFHMAAIDSYDKPDMLGFFEDLSEERRAFAVELADTLIELGGKARLSGTRLLARGWFDISRQTRNTQERVAESAALEDRYATEYRAALSLEWPADIRGLLDKHVAASRAARERLQSFSGD
jgi:uncharacterized protein (TIGR02284 family)